VHVILEYVYVILLNKDQPLSQSTDLQKLFRLEAILESINMVHF